MIQAIKLNSCQFQYKILSVHFGSDLLWEKKYSSDQEKLSKFEAEGRKLAKILRYLEQFIWTVKGQTNFWNRMFF